MNNQQLRHANLCILAMTLYIGTFTGALLNMIFQPEYGVSFYFFAIAMLVPFWILAVAMRSKILRERENQTEQTENVCVVEVNNPLISQEIDFEKLKEHIKRKG